MFKWIVECMFMPHIILCFRYSCLSCPRFGLPPLTKTNLQTLLRSCYLLFAAVVGHCLLLVGPLTWSPTRASMVPNTSSIPLYILGEWWDNVIPQKVSQYGNPGKMAKVAGLWGWWNTTLTETTVAKVRGVVYQLIAKFIDPNSG